MTQTLNHWRRYVKENFIMKHYWIDFQVLFQSQNDGFMKWHIVLNDIKWWNEGQVGTFYQNQTIQQVL